ncbi:armadillo repeat-containing X-linked protein 4, partial [Sesbania bispinosa]
LRKAMFWISSKLLEAFKDTPHGINLSIVNTHKASNSGTKSDHIDPEPTDKDSSTQDMVIDCHQGNRSIPHDRCDM